MDILNNNWFVSIGAPLIVYILLIPIKKLFSKFNKKNSDKKLNETRLQIVSYLEKMLTNKTYLTTDILQMTINSFCRKNKIINKSISNSSVLEDLLVKIYSIEYIDLQERNKIVETISTLQSTITQSRQQNRDKIQYKDIDDKLEEIYKYKYLLKEKNKNRKRLLNFTVLYAYIVVVLIIILYISQVYGYPFNNDLILPKSDTLSGTLMIVSTITIATLVIVRSSKILKIYKKRKK